MNVGRGEGEGRGVKSKPQAGPWEQRCFCFCNDPTGLILVLTFALPLPAWDPGDFRMLCCGLTRPAPLASPGRGRTLLHLSCYKGKCGPAPAAGTQALGPSVNRGLLEGTSPAILGINRTASCGNLLSDLSRQLVPSMCWCGSSSLRAGWCMLMARVLSEVQIAPIPIRRGAPRGPGGTECSLPTRSRSCPSWWSPKARPSERTCECLGPVTQEMLS